VKLVIISKVDRHSCPLNETKEGEMSKEEKKWDLKPIAERKEN
jgi:hypothetical protein